MLKETQIKVEKRKGDMNRERRRRREGREGEKDGRQIRRKG